tara:strand:- start:955 stop:1110 length:156 start_codon:yes stop_codon:yes gene_type:complete
MSPGTPEQEDIVTVTNLNAAAVTVNLLKNDRNRIGVLSITNSLSRAAGTLP